MAIKERHRRERFASLQLPKDALEHGTERLRRNRIEDLAQLRIARNAPNAADGAQIAVCPVLIKGEQRRRLKGKHGESRHERIGEGYLCLGSAMIMEVGEAGSNQLKERIGGERLASFGGHDRHGKPQHENISSFTSEGVLSPQCLRKANSEITRFTGLGDSPGIAKHEPGFRSRLEQFQTGARKESPASLRTRLDQLSDRRVRGLTALPALAAGHPATRRLLAGWGERYHVWHLRRFSAPQRPAIALCFLHAARAEMTDSSIARPDTRITSIHHNAHTRYDEVLRAPEAARSRAVEGLERLGTLVLNDSIPNHELRTHMLALRPGDDLTRLVEGCRTLRAGADGAPLGLIHPWSGSTRQYSPALLEKTPFQLAAGAPVGMRSPM